MVNGDVGCVKERALEIASKLSRAKESLTSISRCVRRAQVRYLLIDGVKLFSRNAVLFAMFATASSTRTWLYISPDNMEIASQASLK